MILSESLQNLAQERLNILYTEALANPLLKEFNTVFKQPEINFTQRGKAAGSALTHQNIIKLNPTLFEQNIRYFISDVIAHELAHILVYQLYGRRVKPHGVEWKKVMSEVFNVAPKVTHTLDVSHVKMRSVMYQCQCQTLALSMIRHNRISNKKQSYICRKCKQVLKEVSS